MLSVEESSSIEYKPIASIDSTHEPSPKPRTPKERLIHPLEFSIKFEDYGNTSKHFWHNPHKEVSPSVEPSKEWLMEVKRSSEAIQILSPSMTMPCSLRGTNIEALHNPTIETNTMSEFLVKTLLSKMPLVMTNKLFKSLSGLIFECCVIVKAVPIEINETKVRFDFHIYAILEFELLIGHPLDNLFMKNLPMGALVRCLGKLLLPLTQISQRRSIIPTMTHSRR